MRYPIVFFSMALWWYANQVFSQEAVRWIQCTDYADKNLFEGISSKLDEPSPIPVLGKAIPLNRLLSMYPMSVVLDERALEEESVPTNEPIVLPLVPGISIRNQLKLILEPLQLTYVEMPGYLRITSRKSSANVVHLYDVTDWVRLENGQSNFFPLFNVIERSIAVDQWEGAGGNSGMTQWCVDSRAYLVVKAPVDTQIAIRDLFAAQRELSKNSGLEDTIRQVCSLQGWRSCKYRAPFIASRECPKKERNGSNPTVTPTASADYHDHMHRSSLIAHRLIGVFQFALLASVSVRRPLLLGSGIGDSSG
jgi:hypothetical protein